MTQQTIKHLTTLFVILFITWVSSTAFAQTAYDVARLQRETLNRGVVAFRTSPDSVCIQWRYLENDPIDIGFEILREDKVIGRCGPDDPTFFMDANDGHQATTYTVRSVLRTREKSHHKSRREYRPRPEPQASLSQLTGYCTLPANAPIGYLDIPLVPPTAEAQSDMRPVIYNANDATMADLDGDGQLEIVLKWDPSNSKDNSQSGITSPTIFEALRLDGTVMWRVNLGRNIRSGAHYVPFIVADLNGDGCAELLVRTSDGTVDGLGNVLGDANADHVRYPDTLAYQANNNPGEQFRGPGWPNNMDRKAGRGGFVYKGPEWVTCFDGKTGKAVASADYIPERGDLRGWGDNYANRSDRFLAACGYLDGEHLSAIFCRGYYTRSVLAAYDFDGMALSVRWVFDTNDEGKRRYAGQGNHNLRVADVDGDGFDEITYGSMAVDHDGSPLYNTGFGHGDAMHLTAFLPNNDALQVWDCHENKRDGSDFRDARTGKVIFQLLSNKDVGRCMAADIDPDNPGLEMWSSASGGICNTKGEIIDSTARIPINFGIWWDGDLLRELLDHETVTKYHRQAHVQKTQENSESLTGTPYDFSGSRSTRLLAHFDDCIFNNGTKSNPALCADVIGDWREEVLCRTKDNRHLRLYVTPIPTPYRFHTFLSDPVYRHSVVMQNVAYNQPTHVGFYFGAELDRSGRLFRGWQFNTEKKKK
ncbi:MAG: rhamnogalacturonan lyase [Bacteroidales bacterium]|nr:rhamnogalacturonan lyase [Bacteroidales bacterium]